MNLMNNIQQTLKKVINIYPRQGKGAIARCVQSLNSLCPLSAASRKFCTTVRGSLAPDTVLSKACPQPAQRHQTS